MLVSRRREPRTDFADVNPSRRIRPPSNFGRPQDALGSRSAQQACRFNSRYLDIGPRRPACDASQGNLLIRPQWLRLRAASPSPVRDQAGARSDAAHLLDAARQVLGPVQKVKGCEVVRTTVIVLATLAPPEHEPGIVTGCGLARLNVHVIGVQRDFA